MRRFKSWPLDKKPKVFNGKCNGRREFFSASKTTNYWILSWLRLILDLWKKQIGFVSSHATAKAAKQKSESFAKFHFGPSRRLVIKVERKFPTVQLATAARLPSIIASFGTRKKYFNSSSVLKEGATSPHLSRGPFHLENKVNSVIKVIRAPASIMRYQENTCTSRTVSTVCRPNVISNTLK